MPVRAPQHRPYSVASKTHEPKQESRQKKRALHTGSKAWRTLRAQILVEELYQCRQCGQPGDHVDHINGDATDNSRGNLAVMCRSCHAIKTAKEDGGFGNRRNSRGPVGDP
ncbi:MAG: HNH endonuclease [Pseudomonadales bacterium]|nr:HNH endonuclease [Pseudomonadales bacterium]